MAKALRLASDLVPAGRAQPARFVYNAMTALALLLTCAGCGSTADHDDKLGQEAETIVDQAPPNSSAVAKGPFAPRDECDNLEGAAQFRERLSAIVQMRDVNALVAIADEDIALDFSGARGIAELRDRLGAESPNLWLELAEMLALGCARDEHGGIIIPWLAGQDLGAIDPSATWLVTGEDVPVHTEPRASSAAIAEISWTLVHLAMFDPEKPFQRIAVPNNDDGFIASDKLRSVLDYRLLAAPKEGRWRIVALVAGN